MKSHPFTMATDREALTVLEQSTVGDGPEKKNLVRFKATVWRDGPNRNHVQLAAGELSQFAASFVGQPFLADHSRKLADRGGTIRESALVETDRGKAIVQTIEARKPWAMEGVLDGTVDRFSIGWSAQRYECTACEMDFFEEDHKHSIYDLGTKDKKTGKTVEVLMSGLEGNEVSAVTHPAVPGTSTDGVMSQLKVASESRASARVTTTASAGGVVNVSEKENRMKELLTLLGLPADTPDAEALAEVKKRLAAPEPCVPGVLLTALGLSADGTVDQAVAAAYSRVPRTEFEAEREKSKKARAAEAIRKAEAEGRLTPAMRKDWADSFAERDIDQAERVFASLPVVVPPKNTTVPTLAPIASTLNAPDEEALRQAGLSREEWDQAAERVRRMKETGEYHVPAQPRKGVK